MKKNNESSYTIFNQMKDCLKKQGLPVFEDDFHCDYNPYRFLSKIQADHYTINILCWFDAYWPSLCSPSDSNRISMNILPHKEWFQKMERSWIL